LLQQAEGSPKLQSLRKSFGKESQICPF